MRWIGVIIVIGAFFVALGGNAASFLDIPTFIITFGGLVALLLFSGTDIPGMFRALRAEAGGEDIRQAAGAWRNAAAFALAVGSVGTIIGLIMILKYMEDPADLGPGSAIGMLTSLYAVVLAFAVCMPIYRSLESRLSNDYRAAGSHNHE